MQFNVISKRCSPGKCLVTIFTFEWPLAGMGLLVAYQEIFISESRKRQHKLLLTEGEPLLSLILLFCVLLGVTSVTRQQKTFCESRRFLQKAAYPKSR